MKIQLIDLGNVGRSLLELVEDKRELLRSFGLDIVVVSISDSKGTAIDENDLDVKES